MQLDGLMDNLGKKYGTPPVYLRKELADYIEDELSCDSSEAREAIYKAISRTCKMADGYPDVASVRAAVWRWSQDGFGDLEYRRPTARDYDPSLAPADPIGEKEQHVLDYERIAESKGIDTSKEGWLVRLLMLEMGRTRCG